MNHLSQLIEHGQSYWLDNLTRKMIENGELQRRVSEEGLRGVTSNPAIFYKAVSSGHDYDAQISLCVEKQWPLPQIYEELVTQDIRDACDILRPVYDQSDFGDGFVSLEVSPHLAHDVTASIEEALRLWHTVERPNLMIKIPGTKEGISVAEKLLKEGVNVNITLLFSTERYQAAAEAYMRALEYCADNGRPINRVASVASFFLSRIDVLIDPLLTQLVERGGEQASQARELKGQVAIASARQAYQIYKEIFKGQRFQTLAEQGARPQRVLWASTGTKNPEYSDIKYVEALIGSETVNTLPQDTLAAYRDHGEPAPRLETELDKAAEVFRRLGELNIDIDEKTQQLENEGIRKFNEPFDSLMATLESKRRKAA